jgi:FkbM family methyltransferase
VTHPKFFIETTYKHLPKPTMIETIHWHTLHPRYLGPDSKVLDLGANYGHFAKAITERLGCHCVAVEPSPDSFTGMVSAPRISKLQLAVAAKSGNFPFHVAAQTVSSSLLGKSATHLQTIEVPALSFADLLEKLEWTHVDLLKVDIEGTEIEMFAACPDDVLRRVAQISVEFHDFCGITPPQEVRKTLSRLHTLGFFSVRMSRIGHQDTWLVNRRLIDISTAELLVIRHVTRNWNGLTRVLKRVSSRARPSMPAA